MSRLALICRDKKCNRRRFNQPDWRCPDHPHLKPVVQANRPYGAK